MDALMSPSKRKLINSGVTCVHMCLSVPGNFKH